MSLHEYRMQLFFKPTSSIFTLLLIYRWITTWAIGCYD